MGKLILILVPAMVIVLLIGGFFVSNRLKTGIDLTPKEKKIIAVQQFKEGPVFYAFNPSSKEKNVTLRLGRDSLVTGTRVSPDGKRLYYVSYVYPRMPGKVALVDTQGRTKEFDFAMDDLWSLPNSGPLTANSESNDCFWSPDSNKLACLLTEHESPHGAGTGRGKVLVLDLTSGNIAEVFSSDQILPPIKTRFLTRLVGWLGNDKLLVIQPPDNLPGEIGPTDFYSVDINSKHPTKEFTHSYGDIFEIAIAPNGKQIFFQSFGGIKEDRFMKRDLDRGQETILISTQDTLGITHPIISEDGSKVVYTTSVFLKPLEKITFLKPEELKESVRSEVHIYDLLTNKERIISLQYGGFIEALLTDGKSFIIDQPEGSAILDSETQSLSSIDGQFIGTGYF